MNIKNVKVTVDKITVFSNFSGNRLTGFRVDLKFKLGSLYIQRQYVEWHITDLYDNYEIIL